MPQPREIVKLLDDLAELKDRLVVLSLDEKDMVDKVLTPEIKAQLQEIEDEIAPVREAINDKITSLEASIRDAVLIHGATVKGRAVQAVWNKPRVSWDTMQLTGYSIAHPEILAFREIGNPYVSLKTIQDK